MRVAGAKGWVLPVVLVGLLACPAAHAEDCPELASDARPAEGCLLELGAFPLEQPGVEGSGLTGSYTVEEAIRRLGPPRSRETRAVEGPRDPPPFERSRVELVYPQRRVALECDVDGSSCGLKGFELTDPSVDVACGLRVGLSLDRFLEIAKPLAKPRRREGAEEARVWFGWDDYQCEDGTWSARHAIIELGVSEEGMVERITWGYFVD